MQPRHLITLMAMLLPLQFATAATPTAIESVVIESVIIESAAVEGAGHAGLRVVNAAVIKAESSLAVDATISRSRLTRVLYPQQLQVNLVNADGTIAATGKRLISAADMGRLNSRDYHLQIAFANVAQTEDYTVSVQWL